MSIHRFLLDIDFREQLATITDADIGNQIKNVLRLTVGDEIIVCNGQNLEALSHIVRIDKDLVELRIGEPYPVTTESTTEVTLYCAILKRENFEWVAQKAVEVGVRRVVPIITDHTVKLNLNIPRIQKIMREAAEQSGRGRLPIIRNILSFDEALVKAKEADVKLFCDTEGEDMTGVGKEATHIALFIGPEGGWSDSEREKAHQADYTFTTLGPRILRAETAAIVATYLATT